MNQSQLDKEQANQACALVLSFVTVSQNISVELCSVQTMKFVTWHLFLCPVIKKFALPKSSYAFFCISTGTFAYIVLYMIRTYQCQSKVPACSLKLRLVTFDILMILSNMWSSMV